MADDFVLKRGDRLPALEATLQDAEGRGVDLTGASVRFLWRPAGDSSAAATVRNAVVIDAAAGAVRVDWQVGDLNAAGAFVAEFEADFGGLKLTFPNSRFLKFRVVEDLG